MGIVKDQLSTVPHYLNESYFVNALKEGLRAAMVKINSIKFTWGSNPGDNFSSEIYRAVVQGEICLDTEWEPLETSLIVKILPTKPDMNFLSESNVYIKEKLTYYDVLPHLETLSDGERFAPKCFYAVEDPIPSIVIEDLKPNGFIMLDHQQLDWNHSALVMKQLAKFHATSMILLNKHPALKQRYKKGFCCKDFILSENILTIGMEKSLKLLISFCSTWPNFEKIAQKLQNYFKDFKVISARLMQPTSSDRYKVLNHGDLWTKNLMFNYDKDTNELMAMKFLDFQFCLYGSPGYDINMFLNTAVELDILQNKRDILIEHYYETFVETLRYMHFQEIPTKDDLLHEVRAHELYGFFTMFTFLPVEYFPTNLSHVEIPDTLTLQDKVPHMIAFAYQDKKFQAQIKYCLKHFDDLGVLDEY